MTDRAFGELTEYLTEQYEKTGRKVIVAMAGDHAPSFVEIGRASCRERVSSPV